MGAAKATHIKTDGSENYDSASYAAVLAEFFKDKEIFGEITIVIKGNSKKKEFNLDKSIIKKDLNDLINAGLSLSAASKYLAKKNGIKKSEIYNLF